jgi:hypothetical protein
MVERPVMIGDPSRSGGAGAPCALRGLSRNWAMLSRSNIESAQDHPRKIPAITISRPIVDTNRIAIQMKT